jgi:hypothetical protein
MTELKISISIPIPLFEDGPDGILNTNKNLKNGFDRIKTLEPTSCTYDSSKKELTIWCVNGNCIREITMNIKDSIIYICYYIDNKLQRKYFEVHTFDSATFSDMVISYFFKPNEKEEYLRLIEEETREKEKWKNHHHQVHARLMNQANELKQYGSGWIGERGYT